MRGSPMITATARTVLITMIASGLVLVAPAQVLSQNHDRAKTEVGVIFTISDPHYTDEFKDEAIPALNEAAAAAIANALDDKIRFLDFSRNAHAAYRLTVRLDRAGGSGADGPAEFGFHLVLTGPEVSEHEPGYLVFRTKDQYQNSIGDEASLIREIEEAMEKAPHSELVRQTLQHVAFANEADLNLEPLAWIVYRDRALLCIEKGSRLIVINVWTDPLLGDTREAFEARVLDTVREDGGMVSLADTSVLPDMIELLRATDPGEVVVERIRILEYNRYCPPQLVPADQVEFSNAGGL